jgi:geranylgeranyl pyrophosphate synthase
MAPKMKPEQGGVLTLEQSKQAVDVRLSQELGSLVGGAGLIDPSAKEFTEIVRDVGLAGGKRLRPHMAMLAYEGYGDQPGLRILPAATALEMLHLALLIHDDVMDGDLTRHGADNVAGVYMRRYSDRVPDDNTRQAFASSMAILAGDLLHDRAHYLFNQTDVGSEAAIRRAREVLSITASEVVAGQILDIQAAFLPAGTIDPTKIARYKTASYSFATPLKVAAILAEASGEELRKIDEMALAAGVAYQMRDDVLGVFGEPGETGKSASNDIREGKFTILTKFFYDSASRAEIDRYESITGNPDADENDIRTARDLLEKHALRPAEQQISRLARSARKHLGDLALAPVYKLAFRDLVQSNTKRRD